MSDDPMPTQGMLLVSAHQLRLIEDDRKTLAARVAALEAGLREWVAASNRLSFSSPDYPLYAERRWRQAYDVSIRLLGEG